MKFKEKNDNVWYDITAKLKPTRNFNAMYEYRIKKYEPKFKIGDWIVNTISNLKEQVTKTNIDIVNKNFYFVKWEPREGELCVFWNDNNKEYFIAKYNTQHNYNDFGLLELDFWYDKSF